MQRWLILPALLVAVIGAGLLFLSSGDADEPAATLPTPSPTTASPPGVSPPPESPTPATTGLATADEILLRLTDLPPGYMIGDDSGCGQITPEGADPPLNQYIAGEFPRFCGRQLEYVCQERPEDTALVITSGVVFLSSEQKAMEGMDVIPSMARWLLGTPSAVQHPDAIDVGDEALVFEVESVYGSTSLLVAWRNGTVVNLIEVVDLPNDQALAALDALARFQDERFANPLPPDESDTYDVQVSLDCGDSDVPVYWPGETLTESGLPEAELARVTGPIPPGRGPGMEYMLEYETADASAGFSVYTWTPEQWQTFLSSDTGSVATSRPCAEPEVIQLEDRTVEIHAPADGCGRDYMAHVFFQDVVVTINVPFSAFQGPTPAGMGPFDTPEALEAIARALTRR